MKRFGTWLGFALLVSALQDSAGAQDKPNPFSRTRSESPGGKGGEELSPKKKGDHSKVVAWFTWEWTFEDDLTAEEFEAKKQVVERWQDMLWKAGEGNFALREVTIVDRRKEVGTMHTPAGLKDAGMLDNRVWARVEYRPKPHMVLPGKCDPFTWLHELGHLLFGCPEEYDSPNGCPCVESTGSKGGKMQWCDASNHSEEQAKQHPPCWEGYILKKYPTARHPGPGGERPDVKLAVRNQ